MLFRSLFFLEYQCNKWLYLSIAEVDEATLNLLQKFGTQCGIAFQLRDDLIGIFGDEATTGKPADTDVREGKHTVLIVEHQKMMNNEQAARFAEWFGVHDAPSEALHQLKQDIDASGARKKPKLSRSSISLRLGLR